MALLVLFGLPFCWFLLLSERVDWAQSRGSGIAAG